MVQSKSRAFHVCGFPHSGFTAWHRCHGHRRLRFQRTADKAGPHLCFAWDLGSSSRHRAHCALQCLAGTEDLFLDRASKQPVTVIQSLPELETGGIKVPHLHHSHLACRKVFPCMEFDHQREMHSQCAMQHFASSNLGTPREIRLLLSDLGSSNLRSCFEGVFFCRFERVDALEHAKGGNHFKAFYWLGHIAELLTCHGFRNGTSLSHDMN
mmetsp:Transcript_63618/g.113227  ORF Transcript_63618/g.113227 Transcript_63618/m.113227 type:complete len:211 (-) Transcript_63618:33-665(-)